MQQQFLSQNSPKALEGNSVSLSSDGNTLSVGARSYNGVGAVFIYVRQNGTWSTIPQTTLLGSSNSNLGISNAISYDGNTLVAGANTYNSNEGAAYVYQKTGSTWSNGVLLQGDISQPSVSQGFSVSISGDGLTIASCSSSYNNNDGALFIFKYNGTNWNLFQTMVGPTGSGASFGISSYFSSDGSVLIVGGSNYNSSTGAAWLYSNNGSAYVQQKFWQGTPGSSFGISVRISGDGSVAVIGDITYNTNGAVFVYDGPFWNTLQILQGTTQGSSDKQGGGCSISENGKTIAFVGSGANNAYGGIWIFG